MTPLAEWLIRNDRSARLWISLHRAAPALDGSQSNLEISLPGYERQPMPVMELVRRTTGLVTNLCAIEFPVNRSRTEPDVSFFGLGTALTGRGSIVYVALLDEPYRYCRRQALRMPADALEIRDLPWNALLKD